MLFGKKDIRLILSVWNPDGKANPIQEHLNGIKNVIPIRKSL